MLGRWRRYDISFHLKNFFLIRLLKNPWKLGGGYHGGNTNRPSEAGDGGTSFADFGQSSLQLFSDSSLISVDVDHVPESGLVVIIPQIDHCCNDHKFPCLLTGESPNGTEVRYCICGNDKFILDVCVCKCAKEQGVTSKSITHQIISQSI